MRKCGAGEYELLIVGHSIPHAAKEAMITEFQHHCPARVLALVRPNETPHVAGAAEVIEANKPDLLLSTVKKILG